MSTLRGSALSPHSQHTHTHTHTHTRNMCGTHTLTYICTRRSPVHLWGRAADTPPISLTPQRVPEAKDFLLHNLGSTSKIRKPPLIRHPHLIGRCHANFLTVLVTSFMGLRPVPAHVRIWLSPLPCLLSSGMFFCVFLTFMTSICRTPLNHVSPDCWAQISHKRCCAFSAHQPRKPHYLCH